MSRAQSVTGHRSGEALCCSECPKDHSGLLHFKKEGVRNNHTLIRAAHSEPFEEKGRWWGQDQDLAELQRACMQTGGSSRR